MKYIKKLLLFAGVCLFTGCADYLDIVPDDVPTMDNAFTNRLAAEKFLFSCYNFLPNPTDCWTHPALMTGDEIWWNIDQPNFEGKNVTKIAQGIQNSNDPFLNYWDGRLDGKNLFIGIRDCNIFLENIHKPKDLEDYERILWTAEVKFLKAYFHFFLLQQYGPIPIVRENIPVSATPDQVRVHRDPVDDVVNYIVELLDDAKTDLPLEITSMTTDAGRITQPIALAVKAKVLAWAASPLFNGNQDYINFKDNKGRLLVSTTYDVKKWERAAIAIKNAIDTCVLAGNRLYKYVPERIMSDTTALKLSYRNAVTEKWNKEIVWASTHDVGQLQKYCMPHLVSANLGNGTNELCAPLKIAEQYYTNNGIPIDEDPSWDYQNRYEVQQAKADHAMYIRTGETTAKLHFNREVRFYASLGFDRGIFEGSGKVDDKDSWYLQMRKSEIAGFRSVGEHIPTGYFLKKLINYETVTGTNASYTGKRYTYPLIRLADLYLLYAEALNEMKSTPDKEVYSWIDLIRERAGLEGVVTSWAKSIFPSKPTTQAGMREIIKRERLIELAFEGQRSGDLRRWKDAMKYLNEPVQGWDYKGDNIQTYYSVTTYWNKRVFSTRDYLWPLRTESITINSNLVQNPGWDK